MRESKFLHNFCFTHYIRHVERCAATKCEHEARLKDLWLTWRFAESKIEKPGLAPKAFGAALQLRFARNDNRVTDQIMPSFIRPASLIMSWFHGGSQTSCTSASSMPSMLRILLCASCAIAGPIPQPGAVKVIFTSTRVPPSSFLINRQS